MYQSLEKKWISISISISSLEIKNKINKKNDFH